MSKNADLSSIGAPSPILDTAPSKYGEIELKMQIWLRLRYRLMPQAQYTQKKNDKIHVGVRNEAHSGMRFVFCRGTVSYFGCSALGNHRPSCPELCMCVNVDLLSLAVSSHVADTAPPETRENDLVPQSVT